MDKQAAIIMTQSKSTGIAVLLALLFGGFGVFYASIPGGIVMSLVELITLAIAIVTLGFGVVLFPIVHMISLIWCIVSVSGHNKRLVSGTV
jgi:hypothetical protein